MSWPYFLFILQLIWWIKVWVFMENMKLSGWPQTLNGSVWIYYLIAIHPAVSVTCFQNKCTHCCHGHTLANIFLTAGASVTSLLSKGGARINKDWTFLVVTYNMSESCVFFKSRMLKLKVCWTAAETWPTLITVPECITCRHRWGRKLLLMCCFQHTSCVEFVQSF